MNQLCFQVSSNDLSFSIIDRTNKQIIQSASCALNSRVAELKREEATNLLRQHTINDFDGEVSLAFCGPKSTLVPQVIYGESNAKDVFELSFGTSENIIEHTRFFEQALVNVYEIEEWIKRFFVIRFPRINIQHETTHILRGIFEKNTFQPTIHLAVNNTHFTVFAVSKNQLDFFNTFEFTNVDDLLYYTLHVVNSLQYNTKEWTLSWHSDAPHNELFDSFSSQMQNNNTTKKVVIYPVSKIKHQLLCV
jgi:hypothetical protein